MSAALYKHCQLAQTLLETPVKKQIKSPALTPAQVLLCRELARQGMSRSEIAKQQGWVRDRVTEATIGIPQKRTGSKKKITLPPEKIRAIIQRRAAGEKWESIAEDFNISRSTLRRLVQEYEK